MNPGDDARPFPLELAEPARADVDTPDHFHQLPAVARASVAAAVVTACLLVLGGLGLCTGLIGWAIDILWT